MVNNRSLSVATVHVPACQTFLQITRQTYWLHLIPKMVRAIESLFLARKQHYYIQLTS